MNVAQVYSASLKLLFSTTASYLMTEKTPMSNTNKPHFVLCHPVLNIITFTVCVQSAAIYISLSSTLSWSEAGGWSGPSLMKTKIHGKLFQMALRYHGTQVKSPGGSLCWDPEVKSTTGYLYWWPHILSPLYLSLSTGLLKDACPPKYKTWQQQQTYLTLCVFFTRNVLQSVREELP